MKKLHLIVLAIISLYTCLNFSSCKKDDDKDSPNSSLYGVWAEDGDPDSWGLLITQDCWIMDDNGKGCASFVPYKNASYDELEKKYAPNDEFFIYRYNSSGNYYILYSGDYEDNHGNILFSTYEVIIARVVISGSRLICEYTWADFNMDKDLVTRDEIMSDNTYSSIPSSADIEDSETRTYYKFD